MIYFVYFSFYYSFGVEKTNTFIRPRGSLENHTRFYKTIVVKIYIRFHTKTAQTTYPLGRHIPVGICENSDIDPEKKLLITKIGQQLISRVNALWEEKRENLSTVL